MRSSPSSFLSLCPIFYRLARVVRMLMASRYRNYTMTCGKEKEEPSFQLARRYVGFPDEGYRFDTVVYVMLQ